MTLGERIREERRKRGWKQRDLAERCGMNQGQISDLENHPKQWVNLEPVLKIARAFGLSVEELTDPDVELMPAEVVPVCATCHLGSNVHRRNEILC